MNDTNEVSLSIGKILSEALEKTNGVKWTFQKGYALYLLIYIALLGIQMTLLYLSGGFVEETQDALAPSVINIVGQVAITALSLPAGMGLFMMGLRRAVGAPVYAGLVTRYYPKTLSLFLTTLLMYVMILVGFICLILPGIYLAVAYSFALPLVVEKNLGPWEALETSRKAMHAHWFTYFGLMLLMGLIILVSAIPLGIGMIWTLPMAGIAWGIIYRNLFGCEPETLED